MISECSWRWPGVVISTELVHFSEFAFVLFCYITNHLVTGLLRNCEFCFLKFSGNQKFTVSLRNSHLVFHVKVERSARGKFCLVVEILNGSFFWSLQVFIQADGLQHMVWVGLSISRLVRQKAKVLSLSKETNQNIEPQGSIPASIESFQNVFVCTVMLADSKDDRIKDSF